MSLLPMADTVSHEKDVKEAKRLIAEKQLVGAANNTKWNELISQMREISNPPCYRTKVVNGYISGGIANGIITYHFHYFALSGLILICLKRF
ncbi:DUF6678 family protein [Pseudoalteromonas mariniglutinosa]|uniref:DUF6678 family protein n=1 Tax=Pseudoalteromonas sp. S1727 TaxID=2066514 RepID=UPI002016969D|nr:DUF6678 family protein [Pseudoalteromonas sp. S1727]